MVGNLRDLAAVLCEVRAYHARILESRDVNNSLTAIQKDASRDRLIRELKDEGVSFHYSEDSVTIGWTSSQWVCGTGIITDVMPVGAFPIRLSADSNVAVRYEPRALGRFDKSNMVHRLEMDKISNSEFGNLNKGSPYGFQGRILYCRYTFTEDRFDFDLHNDPSAGSIRQAIRNANRANRDFAPWWVILRAYCVDLPVAIVVNTIGRLGHRDKQR